MIKGEGYNCVDNENRVQPCSACVNKCSEFKSMREYFKEKRTYMTAPKTVLLDRLNSDNYDVMDKFDIKKVLIEHYNQELVYTADELLANLMCGYNTSKRDDVIKLIEINGANPHIMDEYPLRVATCDGDIELVKYLVEKHSCDPYYYKTNNVNGYHFDYYPEFCAAVATINDYDDEPEILDYFITNVKCEDIELKNYLLKSCLYRGYVDIMKKLVDNGADKSSIYNSSVLHELVECIEIYDEDKIIASVNFVLDNVDTNTVDPDVMTIFTLECLDAMIDNDYDAKIDDRLLESVYSAFEHIDTKDFVIHLFKEGYGKACNNYLREVREM